MLPVTCIAFVLLIAMVPIASFAGEAHKSGWGYSGATGPNHWGDLKPEFKTCKLGLAQSPVDLVATKEVRMDSIDFSYRSSSLRILNNEHTIQANYDAGSKIVIENKTYNLLQFHFHRPSEHTVKGRKFTMEAHLVHATEEMELAVVGVLFETGEENSFIQHLWDNIPNQVGTERTIVGQIQAVDLLPEDRSFLHYAGSLTTPPCTEGVSWYVMKSSLEVSKAQANTFEKIIGRNARPVQPLNDREILSQMG